MAKKFTNELKKSFDYIQTTLLKQYDCDKIPTEYFILSLLENEYSIGNKVLSKVMLHDTMESAKLHFYQWLSSNVKSFGGTKEYDSVFQSSIAVAKELATEQKSRSINSGHVLVGIFSKNKSISDYFKGLGVSNSQITTQVYEETVNLNEELKGSDTKGKVKPIKHEHKEKTTEKRVVTEQVNGNVSMPAGVCERAFINLNRKAKEGNVTETYGNEELYRKIFRTMSKRYKNNVLLIGDKGVGKSDVARNLSNLIVSGRVPNELKDKVLLEASFRTILLNNVFNGSCLDRIDAVVNDARKRGKYIFLFDDILPSSSSYEVDQADLFEKLCREKDVLVIFTVSDEEYKDLEKSVKVMKYLEKIRMEQPNDEECINILKYHSEKLGFYHNVTYDESAYETTVKLCRRYVTDVKLPESAIDVLDSAGAAVSVNEEEGDEIRTARERLEEIRRQIESARSSSEGRDYSKLDELAEQEIRLKSELDFAIKSYNLDKKPFIITSNEIRNCVSQKTGIPLNELTCDDREKLKGINSRIKDVVVGQDEAVDAVCHAIKRHRVGIANPNRPVVFLMAGSTGVGKTYLAKTIAKELFGDENKMVRLDMAEYSDPTSNAKLIGTGTGYIGYDKGGILTEAIKKNRHCVLLLDEIEKADGDVHNTFLSVFDEGRLTDNKGVSVDFRDVIIIMTSNVGAKEVDERGNGIGFVCNTDEVKKEIIEKELKRKFRPEFINRIDKIIYFNKLSDENLKEIIKLEINKLRKRVQDIGYDIDEGVVDSELFENIYNKVKENYKMGARPVARELQNQMEDVITDMVVNGEADNGYVFNAEDFLR